MHRRPAFPQVSARSSLRAMGYVVIVLIVLALVTTGCAREEPTPTLQATVARPTVTATGTSVPTRVPSPAALPTAVPLPPVVVDVRPEPGAEVSPDTSIEIVFSTPVDPESARRALEVRPRVRGDVEVDGPIVRFLPREPFPRGEWVSVRVGEQVKGLDGMPLLRPVYYRFAVQGPLEVGRHNPRDGETGVPVTTTLQLAFNRPVVSVEMTNQPQEPPPWLYIIPKVSGTVRWVGTSLLEFTPQPFLAADTTYTVTVAPPLEALDGAPLTEPISFTFRTVPLRVVRIRGTYAGPSAGEGPAYWPNRPFTVTFSMPVDPETVAGNVRLLHEGTGEPVAVEFAWPRPTVLRLTPVEPLRLGETYRLKVDTGVRAVDGTTPLEEPADELFHIVPPLGVRKTSPRPGDLNLRAGSTGVSIYFVGLLDENTLAGNISVIPEPASVFTYYNRYENRLWVGFTSEADTTYTVVLGREIADIFGNTLGEDVAISFTTGDFSPRYSMNLPWGAAAFDASQPVTVAIRGMNMNTATLRLYRPEPEQAVALVQIPSWELNRRAPERMGTLVREWVVSFPGPRNTWQRVDVRLADGYDEPLAPGIYLLDLVLDGSSSVTGRQKYTERRLLVITPYNVVMKRAPEEVLLWVTDLRTGQPVPNLPVRVLAGEQSQDATTDADGLARVPISGVSPWGTVIVLVNPDSPDGLVTSDWEDGISVWDFNLPRLYAAPTQLVAYVQTERPVYRPGQTIHWRLILRRDNDGVYELPPPGASVLLQITDPNGDVLYEEQVQTDELGTAFGDVPLAEDAPLGFYSVWVDGAEMIGAPTILVAAYRKPEFEITVQASPPEVIAGEVVQVEAQARYFFGAPVANARVTYVVRDEPYTFSWECPRSPCPYYAFGNREWWYWEPFAPVGEPLASGSGKTDAEGRFVLTLPTALKEGQGSRRWTVEVTVHDVSGQVISGRTYVVVHRAAVYPGVATRRYVVRVGEPATADIVLLDTQGAPVPNATVTFVAAREVWRNVRKKGPDGVFRWQSSVEETPVYTETVRLDGSGQGMATFVPEEGGTYRLRVIATDDQGRTASASTYIWVSSRDYVSWRRENNDRLFLVADKATYQVGDVARVLVPSPYTGPVQALITIERGTIRQVWRTTLETNSDVIEVPITADMAPNVFLSVTLVQGSAHTADGFPSFKMGYAELAVDIAERLLTVNVSPARERYRPRDTARFTLSVEDAAGKPVDAAVAVAVVDKAVLSLFERPSPMAQVFYRRRGLGIQSAVTLVKNVNRMMLQEERGGKGGGGGGGGGPAPTVREEFLDVALWRGNVRTGPKGRAVLEVPLPDNLTTWRILAWAVDGDTRVGEGEADFVVSQDFLLRPVLPRFFTVGDEARVGVVAHNLSDVTLRATVTMSVTGASLVGDPQQEIVLAPGQEARLSWTVRDVEGVMQAQGPALVAYWEGTTDVTGVGDAVRMTLPVRYPAPPEVTATAGMVPEDGTVVDAVAPLADIVADRGTLTLSLDASLAAGMLDTLTYLKHFPWECSEQTISRFLPNVVTWRALQRLGVENPTLAQVLPELVATAVQRLVQQQNADGGWGWWPGEKSNPFLTAYGLWALVEADRAGYTVPPTVMEAAARRLFIYLKGTKPAEKRWQNNRLAMVTFALVSYRSYVDESSVSVFSRAVSLFEARDRLDHYGKALLGLTFGVFADTADDAKTVEAAREYLDILLAELERDAVLDPTGVHWEEQDTDWWNMNNDIRSTAMVLLLLARHDPENPLAPNVVRWLMSTRRGDRWTHTQDTAWAVLALTEWMERTGELWPDYDYAAWLNGTIWLSGTMTPANVGETQEARVPLSQLDTTVPNWVTIERSRAAGQSGEGALYYRLTLEVYRPLEDIQPESRGVSVQRWYTVGDVETPVTQARVGDLITVHLRVVASRGLRYMMLEDPLPAGVEPVDVRLLTTTEEASGPTLEAEGWPWWRWWFWQPTHSELRDDRAAFFQTYLPPGTYEITYQVRASIPGTFVVGPAVASQMYAPEVFGRTGTTVFRVEE